jgi:hypothetical protein
MIASVEGHRGANRARDRKGRGGEAGPAHEAAAQGGRGALCAWALLAAVSTAAAAQGPSPAPSAPRQTEGDEYTRYELLEPGTGRFRIRYEVTATGAGATRFFNPIRKGSVATDEAVSDRLTGRPLPFAVVGGREAAAGGVAEADPNEQYIAVQLPRPVPSEGGVRLLIEKTYQDAKSYFVEADHIVFSRPLGIKRNAVVLPAGYELVACNVPAQVLTEADGRVVVSFINTFPCQAAMVLKGRKLP